MICIMLLFLPKLLNYIQDSNINCKSSSVSGSFAQTSTRGSASGPRWGTDVPRSPLYVHPYVHPLLQFLNTPLSRPIHNIPQWLRPLRCIYDIIKLSLERVQRISPVSRCEVTAVIDLDLHIRRLANEMLVI